ncbi:MAG: cryptochrome/photolyase family protein [Cyanobacteriota bacterium]|nr:cryptochrome/photolyase family protein [Cyanobacteriota bacterium]
MSEILLIYPHQLFETHPGLLQDRTVFLIEDPLFFTQYYFHKKKLLLHRSTMKMYADYLISKEYEVRYIEVGELNQSHEIFRFLEQASKIWVCDVCDDWLSRAIERSCQIANVPLEVLPSPNFLTDIDWAKTYFAKQKRYYFTSFYREQRHRLDILLDSDKKPLGGKLTFDTENRKKLPRGLGVPSIRVDVSNSYISEASMYVREHFPDNPGTVENFCYPVTFTDAREWLDRFIRERFRDFGRYEDAISRDRNFLFHSVLTPMLNIGLLNPQEILNRVLNEESTRDVPLNSVEGFVRQIIGWREYMRLLYLLEGRSQRTKNFWNHSRPLPPSFWTANTGIQPIDTVIRRVLDDSYTHHIERLMILGNFMLLCEFDPDDVYRWFMELFIDAYDWVMVPNVYGMSQYADGGLITTKPYVSGSAYVKRMSDFPKGDWCEIWDGLYWRFLEKHRHIFSKNPRSKMVVSHLDRMGPEKLATHRQTAEDFLAQLESGK